MALDSDVPHHYRSYFDSKRCFLMVLLFNSLLACFYYGYEQNQTNVKQNIKTYTPQFARNLNGNDSSREVTRSIELIRQILDNEYDHNGLQSFYTLVEKEFALGLRCTRKTKQPQAILTSNLTMGEKHNSNLTTIRSNSTTTTFQTHRSSRHQRRTLYSYTINNSETCVSDPVDLVVIVISKSENYKTRDAIRRTWGSGKNLGDYSSISHKILFLIDLDEKLSHNIRLENNLFQDIIQVELPQQYTLVTHRVLSLLEWSFRYCRTAKFLFKTDDDIFINFILLLKFISPMIETSMTNNTFRLSEMTIYGSKHYNPTVFRQANDPVGSRYIITTDEFPCSNYPDFLSGFGYLIPKKARDALVYASYRDLDTPFRISDVYITGILPDYLSIPRQPLSDYSIRYIGDCEDFFNHSRAFACAVGTHHGSTADVFAQYNRYWQRVKRFM